MGKLKQLAAGCKCGVYVSINEHRDYYETVETRLNHHNAEVDPEVLRRIVETDTLVEVQFYPDTPIGSYVVHHYDLDAALDEALRCLKERP